MVAYDVLVFIKHELADNTFAFIDRLRVKMVHAWLSFDGFLLISLVNEAEAQTVHLLAWRVPALNHEKLVVLIPYLCYVKHLSWPLSAVFVHHSVAPYFQASEYEMHALDLLRVDIYSDLGQNLVALDSSEAVAV